MAQTERWTTTLMMTNVYTFTKVVFLLCLMFSIVSVSNALIRGIDLGFTVIHVVLEEGNVDESEESNKGTSDKPIYW